MEKNYTLTLSDGTTIENLGLNGTNFVSDTEIDESLFEGNLNTLTVSKDGETIQEMENAVLIQQVKYDDGYYVCFRELSAQELQTEQIQSQIEYLAMMSNVDMEV